MSFKVIIFVCFIGVTLCDQTSPKSNHNGTGESLSSNTIKLIYKELKGTLCPVQDKVFIKIYYETLCPGSVTFFRRQLQPVMEKISSHINVELVPYGFAKTIEFQGGYNFTCQHGPVECYRNRQHACAIDTLKNNTQAVLFNICLMQFSSVDDDLSLDYNVFPFLCGINLNVSSYGVRECTNSSRGQILLKNYGEQTQTFKPKHVPYILLNGSKDYQDAARSNLLSTVCQMLHPSPPPCYFQ